MQILNKDKQRILEELKQSMAGQTTLNQEKRSLSQRTEKLQLQLLEIENETKSIEDEKIAAEMRYRSSSCILN